MNQHNTTLQDIIEELQRPTVTLETHEFHILRAFLLLEKHKLEESVEGFQ